MNKISPKNEQSQKRHSGQPQMFAGGCTLQSGGPFHQLPFLCFIKRKFHNNGRQTAVCTEIHTEI